MFRGRTIKAVVDLLQRREVRLYHACQYQDFVSYLTIGGVPSRTLLEKKKARFTTFQTDALDRTNDVWDKVFVNLSDFGETFAKNGAGVPNPYGPILFRIRPVAFVEAEDVAICLRSAGAKDFKREQESLQAVEDVDRIFYKPQESGYPETTQVKFASALGKEFNLQTARAPEVSCTFPEGVLPLKYIESILVDPYTICDHSLAAYVRVESKRRQLGIPVQVRRRHVVGTRYDELANLVSDRTPTLAEIKAVSNSYDVKTWVAKVGRQDLGWQFKRYGDYLRNGTLGPLHEACT